MDRRHLQASATTPDAYQPISDDVLAYRRTLDGESILVLLNLAHEPRKWEWTGEGECLLSTHLSRQIASIRGPIRLQADEGIIIAVA